MKTILINDVMFSVNGLIFSAGPNAYRLPNEDLRTLADWLQDCCDEMEGGERPIKETTIFELDDDRHQVILACQCFNDDIAALLVAGQKSRERGYRLTADQCDELAKQLRRVARWDRARRAEETEREASAAKAKVEALAKELGADTIIEMATKLKEQGE